MSKQATLERPTEEKVAEDVSLSALMERNPEAFDFSDVLTSEKSQAHPASSLETMLGGYTLAQGRFYFKPLKMKHQKKLLRLMEQLRDGVTPLENLDRLSDAMMQLLAISEGEDYREPTLEEIDEAFSAEEMNALLKKHYRVEESAPGKQPRSRISGPSSA